VKTDIQLEQETQIENKEKSFKSFYQKWVDVLTNYAFGYLKDNEKSTSVVHDIIINFHSNEVKADNLRAYLFRSVRNASLNALGNQKRKPVELFQIASSRPYFQCANRINFCFYKS
jgi:DNA-directed RNA polymerase specialized sigma24 family protein